MPTSNLKIIFFNTRNDRAFSSVPSPQDFEMHI